MAFNASDCEICTFQTRRNETKSPHGIRRRRFAVRAKSATKRLLPTGEAFFVALLVGRDHAAAAILRQEIPPFSGMIWLRLAGQTHALD